MPEHSSDRSAVVSADPDAELLFRLQNGDGSAFAELVRLFGPRLLQIIRRYLNCEEHANDVLQETFLAAFRSINQFQGQAELSTWLHRIAINAALMKLRQLKRHPEVAIEDLLPKYKQDGHRENPGPAWNLTSDQILQSRETQEIVQHSIAQLPTDYRLIILMRDIDEQSTAETAMVLGISEALVKTRLHRARQALRELLDQHFGKANT
jgi:RNA polymerase sigma-70 factor, ECF subfamily